MGVEITKKDVTWSYVAKLFQIGSGLVTLPLILRLLTTEEVGMNYLMLTVSSIVGLMDFGFLLSSAGTSHMSIAVRAGFAARAWKKNEAAALTGIFFQFL